jgi:methionyl aminopeptidase
MSRGPVKSPQDLDAMRQAGAVAARVLREAAGLVGPGLTTGELDRRIGEIIRSHGASSAFYRYREFPGQCCISVNEAVIHGIGGARRLQFGDLVKLDIGVRYKGFVGDVAMSVPVGGCSPLAQKLMDVTAQALYEGVSFARAGNRVNDIGRAVQTVVEANGFGVVREFCGHGVGRSVHEDPQVPNYVDPVRGQAKLRAGMTIAIEPMVTAGNPAVEVLPDRWTVVTRDRQLTAHFEHTVLITEDEPEILTRDEMPGLY